jgi:hypothetical protein
MSEERRRRRQQQERFEPCQKLEMCAHKFSARAGREKISRKHINLIIK